MTTAAIDVEYALAELSTAMKAQTDPVPANAISRAMDALERAQATLAESEREEEAKGIQP